MLRSPVVSLFLCLCCAFVLSCSRGTGGAEPSSPIPGSAAPVAAPVPARPQSVPGVILSRALLWVEQEGLMTPFKLQLNKGDVIGWKNELKTAMRSTDKASREYALVELDGKDYWVQSVFAVAEAVPAVVIGEETVRYARADPRSPNPNGLTIPRYSLVAVHPGQESGLFIGVSAYLEGERPVLIKNEFIKKENVSTVKADVDGMQLYTLAREAKTDVSKRELLRSALQTGSRFNDLIEEELYGKKTVRNSPAADSLLDGTQWNLVYEDNSYEIKFLPGGILASNIEADTTPNNDFWRRTGDRVVFSFNNEYSVYEGELAPDGVIKGAAQNIAGDFWDFECSRIE